jgi:hypothetical protein
MIKNPKQIVSNGYDLYALAYDEASARDPSAELPLCIDLLPTGPSGPILWRSLA